MGTKSKKDGSGRGSLRRKSGRRLRGQKKPCRLREPEGKPHPHLLRSHCWSSLPTPLRHLLIRKRVCPGSLSQSGLATMNPTTKTFTQLEEESWKGW